VNIIRPSFSGPLLNLFGLSSSFLPYRKLPSLQAAPPVIQNRISHGRAFPSCPLVLTMRGSLVLLNPYFRIACPRRTRVPSFCPALLLRRPTFWIGPVNVSRPPVARSNPRIRSQASSRVVRLFFFASRFDVHRRCASCLLTWIFMHWCTTGAHAPPTSSARRRLDYSFPFVFFLHPYMQNLSPLVIRRRLYGTRLCLNYPL